jgi:hypothetical protein
VSKLKTHSKKQKQTMEINAGTFPQQHPPTLQMMSPSCKRIRFWSGTLSFILLCLKPYTEVSSFALLSHPIAPTSRCQFLPRNPTFPIPNLSARPAQTTSSALPTSLTDTAEWRQYVPLAVSVAVILDILLGSPFANAVASRLRSSAEDDDETQDRRPNNLETASQQRRSSKERIDSQKVAQEAIQKAQFTLELRSMLEAQRDPVKELQRRTEDQTALLQQNQAQLQAKLNDELKRDDE